MIAPRASAGFVANMEDVLEVYQRPHDPSRPLVCLDETSKQMIVETRAPIPAAPGRKARHDYEYQRNGVAHLFMMFAPLKGWRHVKVTDRHAAVDYAHVLKDLADTHFPNAAKIALVQDNLSTHMPASLYPAFPAAEARGWGFRLMRDSGLLQQRDLAVDAQDLGHLFVEQRIAAFQIIAHLVRLDLIRGENFAQRALSKIGEAFVSCRRPMFANVSCQKPRRPQLMRIAEILGFAAGKIDNESPCFFGDDPLASRTRTVVESCHDAKPFRPSHASLDRLWRHADGTPHCVKRWGLSIREQHPRSLDSARGFRPRTRKPGQFRYILVCERQLDQSTWSRHDQSAPFRKSPNKSINVVLSKRNPQHISGFKESMY